MTLHPLQRRVGGPQFPVVRWGFLFAAICIAFLATSVGRGAGTVLQLHPDNPHYFLCRAGRPTVLISSGEHYGAVLNADFDYVKYLDALAKDKLNHTRPWIGGTYCEPAGAFNIEQNTLAPLPGRFCCPLARSDQPGYKGGGNKFDLERWDEDYFRRFRDFISQAATRGVVVEVNLFCPFYEDSMWVLSPLHPENNINGVGVGLGRKDVHTLDKSGGTLAIEERLVRRFVAELRDSDNVYYEICNEPYAAGVPMDWQRHMAEVIVEGAERASESEAHFAERGQRQGEGRGPASGRVDLQLPLRDAARRGGNELCVGQGNRRRRDGFQRHRRRALSHRGVGVHRGRRRIVQPLGLLVRRGTRMGRSSITPSSPAAGMRVSGGRCGSCTTLSTTSSS